jgi:hypothetical protein
MQFAVGRLETALNHHQLQQSMGYKELPPDPATGGEFDGQGMCACPVCGEAYVPFNMPCTHLVGDWCFSADYGVGNAKGMWGSEAGEATLVAFDAALHQLFELFEYGSWPSEEERDRLVESVPDDLRYLTEGGNWSSVLDARIFDAPGYLGTHEVVTASMAGDAWSVHWAADGRVAADWVAALFEQDLSVVREVIRRAERAMLPE